MKKILIVEDELLVAKMYSMFLKKLGYEVLVLVNDGNLAVQKSKELNPDIILMDVNLKNNTNGFSAASEIRTFSNAFIIFTTGNSMLEAKEQSASISNCSVLIKPVEPSEIDRVIKNA